MNPLRRVLRFCLGILSKAAIRKHRLELIVVAGWYGTELAREMIYTILNEKLKVRRNTKDIWWDFSIPLAILGYKDIRRNALQWLILLIRASIYLIVGRSNPHILILNADCEYDMTAKYWASFVKPDYLLILNYDKEAKIVRELIKATDKNQGTIIYNKETSKGLNSQLKHYNVFNYGHDNGNKLRVKVLKNEVQIGYNSKQISIPKRYLPSFSEDMLGGVFSVAVLKNMELAEAGFNSLKFEVPSDIVSKIRTNLDLGVVQ